MGRHQVLQFSVQRTSGQTVIGLAPAPLLLVGCNFQVEIATATAFVSAVANPTPRKSIVVMAHLDTGASRTTISPVLAQHLGLVQTGVGHAQTGNGATQNPTYAVDLVFVGTTLSSRVDLSVGSCTLPFDLAAHAANPNDPRNFGVLIGRDIMAAWHLMWDGPTSTVIISD